MFMLFHSVACVAFMWSLVTFGEAFDETKRRRKESERGGERERVVNRRGMPQMWQQIAQIQWVIMASYMTSRKI